MSCVDENYLEVVEQLDKHGDVHAVRSDPKRITVAYAPSDLNMESIPVVLFDHIVACIEDTDWMFEARQDRNAERHRWTGGVHSDPILPARNHPEGFEIQVNLVYV